MITALARERILSIDAFRGLTILVMVFVNHLAGTLARQYVVQKDMPAAIYNNGKQFYLGLKYSM